MKGRLKSPMLAFPNNILTEPQKTLLLNVFSVNLLIKI